MVKHYLKKIILPLNFMWRGSVVILQTYLSVSGGLEVLGGDRRVLSVAVEITPGGDVFQTHYVPVTHDLGLLAFIIPV